jgi:Polyketide cyclase / dehydrase and lipid transport
MAEFRFVTFWNIEAPLAVVCEAIEHSLEWPQWWPGVEEVEELTPGDANGIGSVRRYLWKSRLPYRLGFDIRVTRMQPLTMVEGIACGDVEGVGRWSFTSEGSVTVARYDWQVRPTAFWMRLLTPLAGPLFRWNHDILMQQGAEGLARRLNARLVGTRNLASTPAVA